MRLRFIGQPFENQPNLVDFVEHARDGNFTDLRIAVAWAKQSGLSRIWKQIDEFRSNGGKLTLIVGVSEGGATKEGLELAATIADSAYVYHDPRRTFHPKVYFASSLSQRSLFVGSSNLTAGGLSWNYEASTWVEWNKSEDEGTTDTVTEWFEKLIANSNSCRPLTADLIEQMLDSDDIIISSERRARRVDNKKLNVPEDNDSAQTATISGLFKPVSKGLRKLPKVSDEFTSMNVAVPLRKQSQRVILTKPVSQGRSKSPALAGDAPLPLDNVRRRWVKRLDRTAAQQVNSPNSNPTGNLRLSRVDAQIDHKKYFRDDFFGGLPWSPRDGMETEQEVILGFRTWIDGEDFGVQDLRISHNHKRIAGQGNVPTLLHWGELSRVLRDTDYVGHYVNLEKTDDQAYNLVISERPRGDYRI